MYSRASIRTFVENISQVTGQSTLVNALIEIALRRVYKHHDWPYYLDYKNGILTTVATYETGTISVTNDSTAVTGSSTVWTSAMVGRKIRVSSERPYYRISSINTGAQTLVLDKAYQGTTDTAATYTIFKDEYLLNADVDRYKSFRQTQNAIMLTDVAPKNFDELYTMPQAYSWPRISIDVGNGIDTYTTGTVSAATTVITGTGTSWTTVEGLGKLSKIRIGNNWYTVKSVDSATQITAYESVGTVAAGTAYEIPLNNIIVQLYQIPDTAINLFYRYFRLPIPLANDYDLPDMPYDYHELLIQGVLSELWSQKGDPQKAEIYEQRFLLGLERMKYKIGSFTPDRINMRKSADRLKRNYTRGIEAPTFDRQYSF